MTAHVPPPHLENSTAYNIQRETLQRGANILRCVKNGCQNPRLPPFTTCRKCRGLIWKQAAQKTARSRKRMARAREAAE